MMEPSDSLRRFPAPEGRRIISIVSGRRIVQVELERLDERTLDVVVREDGRKWSFREPSWRSLSFGSNGTDVYWWSARRVVILPLAEKDDIRNIDTEEDILLVFRLPTGWLLVCETSLRLWTNGVAAARIDFSDVVDNARWERGHLVVDVSGAEPVRVEVGESHLQVREAR